MNDKKLLYVSIGAVLGGLLGGFVTGSWSLGLVSILTTVGIYAGVKLL